MKRFLIGFSLILITLLASHSAAAQTGTTDPPPQPNQERLLKQLVDEIHQLRIAVERQNVNSFRGQVLLDRIRLKQAQLNRVTEQLASVKRQLDELRIVTPSLQEKLETLERQQDVGLMPEAEVKAIRAAIAENRHRDQELTIMQQQLEAAFDEESRGLSELNNKLDDLEAELRGSASKQK